MIKFKDKSIKLYSLKNIKKQNFKIRMKLRDNIKRPNVRYWRPNKKGKYGHRKIND